MQKSEEACAHKQPSNIAVQLSEFYDLYFGEFDNFGLQKDH